MGIESVSEGMAATAKLTLIDAVPAPRGDFCNSEFGVEHYADGVTLMRSLYGNDHFRGSAEALVACGLISDDKLPGRPGCGKWRCTYQSNGERKGHSGSHSAFGAGVLVVQRTGKNRFEIRRGSSDEESARRRNVMATRDAHIASRKKAEDPNGVESTERYRSLVSSWVDLLRSAVLDGNFVIPVVEVASRRMSAEDTGAAIALIDSLEKVVSKAKIVRCGPAVGASLSLVSREP